MQLNTDKKIYSAKTENKNNINFLWNRDLIVSKLIHDILILYNFIFLYFNRSV
jgi:hypothetical protein